MASVSVLLPYEALPKFCTFHEPVTWMGELLLMRTSGFMPSLRAATSVNSLKVEPVCLVAEVAAFTWASAEDPLKSRPPTMALM